jgi:hypothetical protein
MIGKLFCGVMYPDIESYRMATAKLVERFGELEIEGDPYDFNYTDYYLKEFGPSLKKRFVIFQVPIKREELPDIKLFTCNLERELAKAGKRVVNIDPGYFTANNVIVASTKEFPSRIYLGKGIYGDLQLVLKRDEAMELPFTFGDYKANKEFFSRHRHLAKG